MLSSHIAILIVKIVFNLNVDSQKQEESYADTEKQHQVKRVLLTSNIACPRLCHNNLPLHSEGTFHRAASNWLTNQLCWNRNSHSNPQVHNVFAPIRHRGKRLDRTLNAEVECVCSRTRQRCRTSRHPGVRICKPGTSWPECRERILGWLWLPIEAVGLESWLMRSWKIRKLLVRCLVIQLFFWGLKKWHTKTFLEFQNK